MKDKPDTTPKCTGPCGSIDCAYGCCRGMPWAGSYDDSLLGTKQYVGAAIKDMIGVGTAKPAAEEQQYTGGSVDYYRVKITNPTSAVDAYTAECNDIIEALGMNYAEGNAFKAIWRKCAARTLGLSKKGYTDGLYDSEKVVFFGQRMVAQEKCK